MEFKKQAARIYTAIAAVTFATAYGAKRSRQVAFRVAPENVRDQSGAYRVDMKTLSFEPWEAIDSGRTFTNARAAQRYARQYRRAMEAQSSYHPQGS